MGGKVLALPGPLFCAEFEELRKPCMWPRHGGIGDGKWPRPRVQGWRAGNLNDSGVAALECGREVGGFLWFALWLSSSLRKLDDVRKVQRPLNHNQLQVQGILVVLVLVSSLAG